MSQASHQTPLNQGELISNMPQIVKWMQGYEQRRYLEENRKKIEDGLMPSILSEKEKTQQFASQNGIYFGLCTYLANGVMRGNVDEFFTKIQNIASSKIPPTKENEKVFYNEMNTFIHEITQLHSLKATREQKGPLQNMRAILNESAKENMESKVLETYFFTEKEKLLEWAKQSQHGDALMVKTPSNYYMMIYAMQNREGRTKVGFYDPYTHTRLEIPQEKLTMDNIESFQPFRAEYHKDGHPLVMSEHIVNVDNMRNPIKIDDDILNKPTLQAAMTSASQQANSNVIERLISKGADYRSLNDKGLLPIHFAALSGNIDGVVTLLKHDKTLINAQTTHGLSPLYCSIIRHHTELAQILINDHPDLLNTPDANGVTPIFYAAIHGHTDLVQALAKENPELLLSKNSDGVPLIRFVALSGNTELVEALAKDHPLTANSDVLTLIDLAAFTGNTKLVQALSKYSPELLLSKNSDGLTPVHLAAFGGHTDLVQVLIKDPAIQQKMPDILGFATETMLANFIKAGVELSQEFIQTKLNLSYTNKKGESNLHLAIHGGNSKTIKALIDSGADYTQVNLLDQTPLDIAIISGNLDTLKVFLDHNPALLTQKNAKGLTPLDLATTLNNEEMVQELLKRAANIDALTQYGATTASLAPTASTTKKSLVPEGGRLSAIIKAAKEMKPHIVHSTDLPPTSTPTATSVTQTAKKIATEALGPSRTLERTTSVEDGVGAKRRDDAHTRRASEGDHNHF